MSPVKKIRFGVLGCADILKREMGDAIKQSEHGELVCVASRSPEIAQQFSKLFSCEAEIDYESLLRRSDIDAVYIPLPVGLHEKWCIVAANYKKHIICEKSLSFDLKSCNKIIQSAKANNILIIENFMCDFHSQHVEVLKLLMNKSIGNVTTFIAKFGFPPMKPDNIRYQKDLGGGALNDNGAYVIFMARKFFDSEPIEAHYISRFKNEIDDSGSIFLIFPDQKVAHLTYGFSFDYQNNYELWGSEGAIFVNRAFSIPPQLLPNVSIMRNNQKEILNLPPCNHFIEIINDFTNAIIHKKNYYNYYDKIEKQANAMKLVRGR